MSKDLPDRFRATHLYSPSDRRYAVAEQFGVTPADSVEAAATSGDAEFAIVAVPWPAAPEITIKLVELGLPVLVETPPAPDVEGMRTLWSRIGHLDRVHVADQSMYMPTHQSRLAMIRAGLIGEPTSVQVCSNHLYHAVSIMRGLLGAGKGITQVRAHDFTSPLLEPISWDGFTHDPVPQDRVTTIATIDFGNGRSGLYDFTGLQWFNPLRQRRLIVRGTHGEIVDDRLIRMEDATTVVESRITRRQLGIDMNLEGFALDNIAVDGTAMFRNPFRLARQSDEDIAAGLVVESMGHWVRGQGSGPYPLADGLQDHLIGLAIEQAARTDSTITTHAEAWSEAPSPF